MTSPSPRRVRASQSPARRVRFNPGEEPANSLPNSTNGAPSLGPNDGPSDQLLSETQGSASPSSGKKEPPSKKKPAQKTTAQKGEDMADAKMFELLRCLRELTVRFCERYFDFNVKGPIETAFLTAPPELIKYVGCVANGGPNGREGWRELIEERSLRKALVYGIISRVLQVHVIASLYFAADAKLINKLDSMEKSQVEKDGFYRAAARATVIRAWKKKNDFNGVEQAIMRITMQIERLLRPIRELDYKLISTGKPTQEQIPYATDLGRITRAAVAANTVLRENGNVVYYFQPVFKDEEFEPERMECQNLLETRAKCPYPGVDTKGKEVPANDPRGDPTDQCLVRIVCSYGCVAHRKGGGDLGKQMLEDEEDQPDLSLPPEARPKKGAKEFYGRVITHEDGFRTKTVARAVVAIRWGKVQYREDHRTQSDCKQLSKILEELRAIEETEQQKSSSCSVM